MGSKYRANIGLNQTQMDSLADRFPEINDINKFPNFTTAIQYLLSKIISGELIEKSLDKSDELNEKIKQQQYLKLCLQNWQLLKSNGTIYEEAKAIITGKKELETPTMQPLLEEKQQTKMLIHDYFCEDCKHYHARSEPHVCTLLTCNCGVRG